MSLPAATPKARGRWVRNETYLYSPARILRKVTPDAENRAGILARRPGPFAGEGADFHGTHSFLSAHRGERAAPGAVIDRGNVARARRATGRQDRFRRVSWQAARVLNAGHRRLADSAQHLRQGSRTARAPMRTGVVQRPERYELRGWAGSTRSQLLLRATVVSAFRMRLPRPLCRAAPRRRDRRGIGRNICRDCRRCA